MKVAFYYSSSFWNYQRGLPGTLLLTIDGKQYTECVTLNDDDPVAPSSNYDDNQLVMLVENAEGDMRYGISYDSATFKGRIINKPLNLPTQQFPSL